ncbi:MAG: hypothetical protein CVT65_02155 [Actinobacteria bacterium HGW-Actinobacteria-5]|nr:MAG: hypothetical protein CVT65_02155 [Actinobacteria bacterium HGW-Actinobacteria-5]
MRGSGGKDGGDAAHLGADRATTVGLWSYLRFGRSDRRRRDRVVRTPCRVSRLLIARGIKKTM